MENVNLEELLNIIQQSLENQDYQLLKQTLVNIYPMDLAEIFDELSTDEQAVLFRLLHKDQAAEVFSYLNSQQQKEIASTTNMLIMNHIIEELYFDDKIDFLGEMPANFVKTLLANSSQEERGLINQFLHYEENSAGSLMTIEYVDLKKTMSVDDALRRIKQTGMDKETIYTCYVLDSSRKLQGTVSLRRLVLADGYLTVDDVMDENVIMVEASDDQEAVAELFKRYDLMAIPVVDSERRLIGIITIDDIVDVIEQENTEDFQKMAAMEPSDEPYLDAGIFHLARNRIVWLLVLMISATFTGGIISHYEELLSAAVILTSFIPMLMDSGGNAGSQSSTLVIRGIALGDIKQSDWYRVLWKEFRVSLLVGVALMCVNIVRMMAFTEADLQVSLTVSLTLACTIILAKLVGGLLPLGAKALKLDPAIMAGPLITTIVDALALFIYFTFATHILQL